jgi:hypothetical protein
MLPVFKKHKFVHSKNLKESNSPNFPVLKMLFLWIYDNKNVLWNKETFVEIFLKYCYRYRYHIVKTVGAGAGAKLGRLLIGPDCFNMLGP